MMPKHREVERLQADEARDALVAVMRSPGATPVGTRRRVIGIQPEFEPATILVVDDRPDERTPLVGILAAVGYETREAASGEEAMAQARETPPDAILMSVWPPELDGLAAIGRLHRIEALNLTPIIAVSASADERDRQRILAVGADEFIGKPFRELDLLECLRSRLDVEYVYAPGSFRHHSVG